MTASRRDKEKTACRPCCSVESLVAVDDRGQMVLPKDVRERMGIKPGDKLAVVCWEREGSPCCVTLIRADLLATSVMDLIGPAMGIGAWGGHQERKEE